MTRLLPIDSCKDCKHRKKSCEHPYIVTLLNEQERRLSMYNRFKKMPDWCPLEKKDDNGK